MIDMLTNSAHPKNAKDDHSKMLTEMEVMVLSRWVDTNYQFYGKLFRPPASQWVKPDRRFLHTTQPIFAARRRSRGHRRPVGAAVASLINPAVAHWATLGSGP